MGPQEKRLPVGVTPLTFGQLLLKVQVERGHMPPHGVVVGLHESLARNAGVQRQRLWTAKGQNFHESFLDLTFLIAASEPKSSIY
jgi:hypothetical protein